MPLYAYRTRPFSQSIAKQKSTESSVESGADAPDLAVRACVHVEHSHPHHGLREVPVEGRDWT